MSTRWVTHVTLVGCLDYYLSLLLLDMYLQTTHNTERENTENNQNNLKKKM